MQLSKKWQHGSSLYFGLHCCSNEEGKRFSTMYLGLAFIYSESLPMFDVVQPSAYFVAVGHQV